MAHSIISKIRQAGMMNPQQSVWIGVDVHKRSYYIALVIGDNPPITWSADPCPKTLIQTLESAEVHPEGVCFEAGPTGFTLARELSEAGIPCIVAAPSKVPRSVSPGSKTDRLDCIKLARFASKGLIRPIAIPSPTAEAERALLRRRHQITDNIRRAKQRIKALFLFHGFPEPQELKHWSNASPQAILATRFPIEVKYVLQSHIRELLHLISEQKEIDKHLRSVSHQKEHASVIEALTSIPGVGFITAMTFHLEVFEPERFERVEEIASYLGLAPTVRQSGNQRSKGHLIPVGQKRLRSLLIESSWIWIGQDEYASSLYRKFISRSGVPQKAIAAVARKLAVILWRLSIEKRAYYSRTA